MRSLHDAVDTSTSIGRMVAGGKFGRPAKLNADQAALARRMGANGETAATICGALGIGRTTLHSYLAESGED